MRRGVALLLIGADEFRRMVAEAVDALPERFRREVGRTVEFVVDDEVPAEVMGGIWIEVTEVERARLRAETDWPEEAVARATRRAEPRDFYPEGTAEVYAVYLGDNLQVRARAPLAVVPPSTITIFMGPCLRANPDEDALRFQVRNLVEHELGHHFGLTEEEVARAHRRKRGGERKNPGY